MPQLEDRNAFRMQRKLDFYCDPIPTWRQFLEGVTRRSDNPDNAGQLRSVVRALASNKQHYRWRLWQELWGPDAAPGAPLAEACPNAVLGDGWAALTPDAFEASKRKAGVPDDESYVKHILEKHSGEARHGGARVEGCAF